VRPLDGVGPLDCNASAETAEQGLPPGLHAIAIGPGTLSGKVGATVAPL
jgi:hypothetical protein